MVNRGHIMENIINLVDKLFNSIATSNCGLDRFCLGLATIAIISNISSLVSHTAHIYISVNCVPLAGELFKT